MQVMFITDEFLSAPTQQQVGKQAGLAFCATYNITTAANGSRTMIGWENQFAIAEADESKSAVAGENSDVKVNGTINKCIQQLREREPDTKYIVAPYVRTRDATGASAAAEASKALGSMADSMPSPSTSPAPASSAADASTSSIGSVAEDVAKQAAELAVNEIKSIPIGVSAGAVTSALLIGGVAAEVAASGY